MSDGSRPSNTNAPSPHPSSSSYKLYRGHPSRSSSSSNNNSNYARPSSTSTASNGSRIPLYPPAIPTMNAALLGRSVSADTPGNSTQQHRNSARGHAYLSSGGVAAAAARRSGATAASAASSRSHHYRHSNSNSYSSVFMMDMDAARRSVDASSSRDSTRSALGDSTTSFSSSGRFSSTAFSQGPQIPPDSTISAEDVIRESLASARSTAAFTDPNDFAMSRSSAASGSYRQTDSFAFSFSSRSTFRRSTISETMLQETESFEPERALSVCEVSEVLSASHLNESAAARDACGADRDATQQQQQQQQRIEVTSIKEEEEHVKLANAKSRWAMHVKLKARNFLFATMATKGASAAADATAPPTPLTPGGSTTTTATANNAVNAAVAATPSMAAAQAWANQQKIILATSTTTHSSQSLIGLAPATTMTTTPAAGAAKLQKWNRWMQQQYQHNIGKVMQRAFKEEFLIGQSAAPPHASTLLSIEEVVSNPRMMRYLAAYLSDVADQSKLFFLCSFEEYQQFWCTLRANYAYDRRHATIAPFSKDDVLMLRTYGVKIAMKYLAKSAQFHIGSDLVDSELLRQMKRDLATGGEDALRTFDRVATRVKRVLMFKFPAFRQTELYTEMLRSVEREVICLEEILMNHRFANFFWIFLFPHNYHREIGLWLDIEYEFKPAFRTYVTLSKETDDATRRRRYETRDHAAYQCRKLLTYIAQKYYPRDVEMQQLDKSVTAAYSKLQIEQDAILAKFSLIHLELYHRFLTSRAYAEFALYPCLSDDAADASIDDTMRLSSLLLSYGLRAHHWPDGSRESQKSRSLDVLPTTRGFEAICGVLTFDAVAVPTTATGVELRVTQHALPHDATSDKTIDKSIENFLVPWADEPHDVVVTAATCPAPLAFNFRVGDSSSATELYAASIVIYRPAPVLSVKQFEKLRLDAMGASRWVPYGVCVVSKFPLVDLLRARLAEAYEFILELETIDATREKLERAAGAPPKLATDKEPFTLEKKVLAKLARPVLLEHISQFHQPSWTPSLASSALSVTTSTTTHTAAQLSTAMLATLPRLDHSMRILFDTLDIATVLLVFTAALFESRILFISSYYSVLLKASEALRALMYPLLWPHVYLPVLPKRMLAYLECPTPFIFGVATHTLDDATMAELLQEDLLIVDLDKGCVLRGDVPCALPSMLLYPLRDALYKCLKPNVSRSDHVFANHFPAKPLVFPEIAVRTLFYRTVQHLIGDFGYHRYVWTDEHSQKKMVFFDEASYLAASPPAKREFLTLFIATQAFSEFMVSYHGFEDHVGATPYPTQRVASLASAAGRSSGRPSGAS